MFSRQLNHYYDLYL